VWDEFADPFSQAVRTTVSRLRVSRWVRGTRVMTLLVAPVRRRRLVSLDLCYFVTRCASGYAL
jgi:hypothetical protein